MGPWNLTPWQSWYYLLTSQCCLPGPSHLIFPSKHLWFAVWHDSLSYGSQFFHGTTGSSVFPVLRKFPSLLRTFTLQSFWGFGFCIHQKKLPSVSILHRIFLSLLSVDSADNPQLLNWSLLHCLLHLIHSAAHFQIIVYHLTTFGFQIILSLNILK